MRMLTKVLAVSGALLAFSAYAGWRLFIPKLGSATGAQIRAALPRQVLDGAAPDREAEARFTTLSTYLVSTMAHGPAYNLVSSGSAAERKSAADEVYTVLAPLRAPLDKLLASGPLRYPTGMGPDKFFTVNSLWLGDPAFGMSGAARVFAQEGDFAKSTDLFLLSIKLEETLLKSRGGLNGYTLSAEVQDHLFEDLSQVAAAPGFPASEAAALLAALGPEGLSDKHLKEALASDFQDRWLRSLGNPKAMAAHIPVAGRGEVFGTYDPIKTAHDMGAIVAEAMDQADRPFSKVRDPVFRSLTAGAASLPRDRSTRFDSETAKRWNRNLYQWTMNSGDNTIGRQAIAWMSCNPRTQRQVSCYRQAERSLVRVLLASVVYRAGHGGTLPLTTDGFLPVLGAWPTDPFTGRPLIYVASRRRVESLGLTDRNTVLMLSLVNVAKPPLTRAYNAAR